MELVSSVSHKFTLSPPKVLFVTKKISTEMRQSPAGWYSYRVSQRYHIALDSAFADKVERNCHFLAPCMNCFNKGKLILLLLSGKPCSAWRWVKQFQPGSDSCLLFYQGTHCITLGLFLILLAWYLSLYHIEFRYTYTFYLYKEIHSSVMQHITRPKRYPGNILLQLPWCCIFLASLWNSGHK
jgi:hypothetical protein